MSNFFDSQVEIYNQNPIIYDVITDDMKKYEQVDISSSGIGIKDSNDNNLQPEIYLYNNEGVKQNTGINMNINNTTGKHELNFIIKGSNKMTINDDGISGNLPTELPSQSGNANKILTTNGTTTTWTDAPTLTIVNSSTGINGGIKFGSNTGVDGSATGLNLRVSGTTVVGVSSSTVTSTGVINITHSGSASNPSLSFGDRVAGSLSGIYSNPTDDNINICTGSVERLRISNTTTFITNNLNVSGNVTSLEIQFGGSGASITGANAGANSSVNIRTESADRVVITTNDTTINNSVNLPRGLIKTYLIVDGITHLVSRLTPSVVILTRSYNFTTAARVQLPIPSNVPSGFGFRLYIFNLPGRNNTGLITNQARLLFDGVGNNALLFDNSGEIKFFAGNTIYEFATSTSTYTVLDIFNMRDWESGKSRWIVTPISKWVEPSPATSIWLGNDN